MNRASAGRGRIVHPHGVAAGAADDLEDAALVAHRYAGSALDGRQDPHSRDVAALGDQPVARLRGDEHLVVGDPPGAGQTVEVLGAIGQPVQGGQAQEAERVAQLVFAGTVPVRPVGLETGRGACGHDARAPSGAVR
ncbi:hypothetical protein [Nocardia farcinica]|uniref:hypothetical protein n=1 Tax=Nocardia farcinica TaxID=37329 RepID=UPI002B4B4CC0|nr:hypothetical protein [Nocardia farcinica]